MPTMIPGPMGYYISTEDPDVYNFRTIAGFDPDFGPYAGTRGDIVHRRRQRRWHRGPEIDDHIEEEPEAGPIFAPYFGPNYFGGPNLFQVGGRRPREVHDRDRWEGYPRRRGHGRHRHFGFEDGDDDSGWPAGGRQNRMGRATDDGHRGGNRVERRGFELPRLMGGGDGPHNFFIPGRGNRRRQANHAPFMRMF